MAETQELSKTSLKDMPYEGALKELEAIVRKLESGAGDLEGSINEYVRGTQLKDYCLDKLKTARLQVESILKTQSNGQDMLALQPFDAK